ncbi:MAG TPA: ATP-binding protein [Steroidobacteraceae bacterium]|jgi:signal transduction histidine kinase|nr:ATP-binding protein [Steroidobacteraceae bacterium]
MARLRTPFANAVAACVVALHLIILPLLYFGLGYVIRKSHEDMFIEHARTFARVLADEFELGVALDSESRTEDLLDVAVIHGDARYAEVSESGRRILSKLGSTNINAPRRTDLKFDDGDGLYFVVLPIEHAGRDAELRLGFDEQPTLERIRLALNRMLMVLGVYFVVAIAVAVVLSKRMSRPIHRLQEASRTIASGSYTQALQVSTGIRELHELGNDLEDMRRNLVGVNERLQAKIKEKEASEARREELQNQLRHRQRLETVGTLAGGIAHEFNNVLVPIILFTDAALQDLPASSASRADLERVLGAAHRAKDVVRKILTFSSELGDVKLTLIDLKSVVSDGLNLLSALIPSSIEIRTDFPEFIPPVCGDPTLAVHLVINLCTNAYQSIQGGQGVIAVGLRYAAPSAGTGGIVEFSVADNGRGMDAVTVERIFEPFFTTRSVGEGTGLGLSVVHGIVETFGASIVVDTQLGTGSTFRIIFPAVMQADRAVDEATPVS